MTLVEKTDPIHDLKFEETKKHPNSDLKQQKTIGSLLNSID
jgi:hypothetical protein